MVPAVKYGRVQGAARCSVVAGEDGKLPEWVELLPAGAEVHGRDGRRFLNPDPAAILLAFERRGVKIPIDWEHASELKAPKGEEAPAAGWIEQFELRSGAIWGRVDWTQRGAESVRSREYRYLSPVLGVDVANRVKQILSAALTNQPNLQLSALNSDQETKKMDPEILEILGLSATATTADVLAAIKQLGADAQAARNRAETPSLDKYVPRADYDAALNRATTAEKELAVERTAKLESTIEAEIAAALKAGKITPPTVDYHRAQCRQQGGLERFRAFVQAAPVVAGDTNLGERRPEGEERQLNAAVEAVAKMFGNTPEDIRKYGQA